jgi:hypothetical protein
VAAKKQTDAERWGIALAAPIYVRQSFPLDVLGGGPPPTRGGSSQARDLLRDLSSITNRAEALNAIDGALGAAGLLAIYEKKAAWLKTVPPEVRAMSFLVLDNPEHLGRAFVRDHVGREEECNVVAWDVARAVHYAGLAYRGGYLAAHETWAFVVRAAEIAKASYDSWKSYGRGFVYGRWFWVGHFDVNTRAAQKVVVDLTADEKGPWKTLQWELDLSSLATLAADPGDPGGPLRSLGLRVALDCPECLMATLVSLPCEGARCTACDASIAEAAESAWATAWAAAASSGEPDDDDDDDDNERGGVSDGQSRDRLELGTNIDDQIERVGYIAELARCICGVTFDGERARAAVGAGKIVCACGRETLVSHAPKAIRSSDVRARYVVGGPLRVGDPEGLITILASEG